MNLFVKTLGEGRPLLILHGLFGSGDNWITHARELATHFKVYLVDQRNHGHSSHSAEFSYKAMAEDLLEFAANENLRDITLLGHSMGGKTAMYFAQENAFLIDRVVVADMGIKQYKPHHEEIFKGLFAVDVENCPGRKKLKNDLRPLFPMPARGSFCSKISIGKSPENWHGDLICLFCSKREARSSMQYLQENAIHPCFFSVERKAIMLLKRTFQTFFHNSHGLHLNLSKRQATGSMQTNQKNLDTGCWNISCDLTFKNP